MPGTPEERFEWMARGNPAGQAEWFLAINGKNGDIVGSSSIMPKELLYNGRKFRGGIIGDIMVSPACRGKGIALQIQQVILGSLVSLKMEFLYVVPNQHSKKILVQSGFGHVVPLINYVMPVDITHYFTKFGRGFPVKFLGPPLEYFGNKIFNRPVSDSCNLDSVENGFDGEIEAFWQSLKDTSGLIVGSKSVAYLKWKYSMRQMENFFILKYRRSSGDLAGYCVFHVSGDKIHVYELVSAERKYDVYLMAVLRCFAKTIHKVGIYFYTVPHNPILKKKWRLGICRIGGDIQLLCLGKVFESQHSWLFFAGDRNI